MSTNVNLFPNEDKKKDKINYDKVLLMNRLRFRGFFKKGERQKKTASTIKV